MDVRREFVVATNSTRPVLEQFSQCLRIPALIANGVAIGMFYQPRTRSALAFDLNDDSRFVSADILASHTPLGPSFTATTTVQSPTDLLPAVNAGGADGVGGAISHVASPAPLGPFLRHRPTTRGADVDSAGPGGLTVAVAALLRVLVHRLAAKRALNSLRAVIGRMGMRHGYLRVAIPRLLDTARGLSTPLII